MKKVLTLSLASLLVVGSFAFADSNKAKSSHGGTARGTIASVDQTAKTFVLRDAAGKEMTVSWNDATKVKGGSLKEGEQVQIRTVDKNGGHVATSISIEPSKPAKAAKKP